MRHTISIKNKDNVWEHFIIPEEIYLYIMQLETYINFNDTALLRRYPERFAKAIQKEQK